MDNQTIEKIVEGATADIVKEPYIKAEISEFGASGLTITTEYNCNNKREAAAMVATLAAEICESRADFNALMTLCKKQMNYEKRQEMAERRRK